MRKYLASLFFMGFGCVVVPLSAAPSGVTTPGIEVDAAVVAPQVRVPAAGRVDQVAMVLVGAALIGLAAAVRRAA